MSQFARDLSSLAAGAALSPAGPREFPAFLPERLTEGEAKQLANGLKILAGQVSVSRRIDAENYTLEIVRWLLAKATKGD